MIIYELKITLRTTIKTKDSQTQPELEQSIIDELEEIGYNDIEIELLDTYTE